MPYPENYGAFNYGSGLVVLPAPSVDPTWNAAYRGYEDNTFRWGLVVGLEPDPDLGFKQVTPASYRLEITPHLGWTNDEEMFEPYAHQDTHRGNSRLTVITDLVVGEDLIVQDDESVVYTVPIATMKRILAPGFERYIWRVRAVSPEDLEGHPSAIQTFRGRVVVANLAWTVNPVESPASAAVAIITGKRESSVASIEVNADAGLTTFPSPTTWRIDVPLAPGRNVFFLRAFDTQGNGSEYRSVEIDLTTSNLITSSFFNRFDDFGLTLAIDRLPGERNLSFKERIQDVLVHRADPTYPGLMNAIGRELDLTCYDQALLLKAAVNPGTQERWRNVACWITPRHFCVRRDDFLVRHEYHEIEGRTWQVRPDRVAEGVSFFLESDPGVLVPVDDYRVEYDEDGPFVQFLKEEYAGKTVYLSYTYVQRISTLGKTVEELVEEIEDLQVNGKPVVTVTIHADLPDNASAEGLQQFPPTPLNVGPYKTAGQVEVDDLPLRWAPARLYALSNPEFKWRFRNEHGSQFGTEYAGWAYRLKRTLKTTWGYLVADESVWGSPGFSLSGAGSLDLIFDPFRGRWISTRGDVHYALGSALAVMRGYRDPRDGSFLIFEGVPWHFFWAGIGYGYDLYVIIDSETSKNESDADEFVEVVQIEGGSVSGAEELGFGVEEVDSSPEGA